MARQFADNQWALMCRDAPIIEEYIDYALLHFGAIDGRLDALTVSDIQHHGQHFSAFPTNSLGTCARCSTSLAASTTCAPSARRDVCQVCANTPATITALPLRENP